MDWLNLYGLALVVLLLIPNILYCLRCPNGFPVRCHSKALETLEQIGRFGCMAFMVLSFPAVCFPVGKIPYLILGSILMSMYWLGWMIFWRKNSLAKALILSILPTLLFLESGFLTGNVLLILLAVMFGFAHITINVKNAE